MTKKYIYEQPVVVLPGYQLPSNTTSLVTSPAAYGSLTEITSLYDNGVLHNAFGDISGSKYLSNGLPDIGDSTNDVLNMNASPDTVRNGMGAPSHNMLIWDENTTSVKSGGTNPDGTPTYVGFDLYGGTGTTARYGLPGEANQPGGVVNTNQAIEIIEVGQNTGPSDHTHDSDGNLVNLSFNNTGGGIGFTTAVTIIGGPGRDVFIGGEAGDLIYGGDDHTQLGDGIWGGGGDDTIYGGANLGDTVNPGLPSNTGADDLYGYSGNDIIYGANDGDVYYGDAGTDILYGATMNGIAAAAGHNGNAVTFFGGDGNDTMFASTGTATTKEFFFGGNPYFNPNATTPNVGGPGVVTVGDGWVDHKFVQKADNLSGGTLPDTGAMDIVSYVNATTGIIVDLTGGGTATYQHDTTYQFYDPVGMNTYVRNNQAIPDGTHVGTGAGGALNDIFYGIEGIIGGTQGDFITGDSKANFLSGLGGDDTLFGGAGNDTLWGGTSGNAAIDGTNTLNGNGENDIIVGGAGVDSIYGGTGLDSINGGAGNDVIFGSADVAPGGNTSGWDGTAGDAGVSVAVGTRYQTLDSIAGGTGIDTLNLDDTTNNPGLGAYYSAYTGGVLMLSGIEIITATALADVINLTNGSNAAYTENVSIFAGDNNDVVFSGSGADMIVGDASSGGVGSDTLFGGAGADTIFGDLQDATGTSTFGMADSINGGLGNDTIFGGGGNDTIADSDGTSGVVTTSILGGEGSDFISVAFTNTQHIGLIDGGANSGGDLADTIYITGSYDHVISNLGLGNDIFIGGGFEASPGVGGTDVVNGDDGNDVIAGWLGNDTLYGGSGGDALWGGAGTDTIFGGDGNDVIYPGDASGGSGNIMYGGTGDDGYWIERSSGIGNEIWDEGRIANNGTTAINYIVVQPNFTSTDTAQFGQTAPDYLTNGQGVFETDHDIMNNSGMVQVTDRSGDMWSLNIISGVGAGTTNVLFDDRDITQIVLWNGDANGAAGEHVLQIYTYNSGTHHWDFTS